MSSGHRFCILLTAVVAPAGCDSGCDSAPPTAPSVQLVPSALTPSILIPVTPVPSGVECPTDAPGNVRVSSHDGSLDITFDPVPRATSHEVELQRWDAKNEWKAFAHGGTTERSIAFRPGEGKYQARVRARGCMPGGLGNWSDWVPGSIDGPRVTPPPTPQPTPCLGTKRGGTPPPSCK